MKKNIESKIYRLTHYCFALTGWFGDGCFRHMGHSFHCIDNLNDFIKMNQKKLYYKNEKIFEKDGKLIYTGSTDMTRYTCIFEKYSLNLDQKIITNLPRHFNGEAIAQNFFARI